MTIELLAFCAATASAGAAVGVLGGLLGIGGGLILVPVLYELIGGMGAPPQTALLTAIGTSLATVIVTGSRAALSYYRHGSLDFALIRAWAPAMLCGAVLGAEMANRVDTSALITFFASISIMLAIYMVAGRSDWRIGDRPPRWPGRLLGGGLIGLLSAMLGLGVAGLGVPLMTLYNAAVRPAVAAAALLGALTAMPAVLRFMIGGWAATDLAPWSIGYVNVLGFGLIATMTLLMAPLGVALSHRVDQRRIKQIFAGFLVLNAVRMLFF